MASQRYSFDMLIGGKEKRNGTPCLSVVRHVNYNWTNVDVVREGLRCLQRMISEKSSSSSSSSSSGGGGGGGDSKLVAVATVVVVALETLSVKKTSY